MIQLTEVGKEELAFALLLLKDFKCAGRFDPDVTLAILSLAKQLDVLKQYDALITKIPVMKIEPR